MNIHVLRKMGGGLLFAAAMLVSLPAAAVTGRITDSVTGKPIAGATVYAAWYDTTYDGRRPCGGYTVATTDANGDYDIGVSMTFHTWWHDASYWVVASSYRGSDTLTSKNWSTMLVPLDNLPLNDKLRAIPTSGRIENCTTSMQPAFAGAMQLERATRAAQFAVMCDPANGDTTPQTDEFLHVIPNTVQAPLLWRVFVNPLLPRQTSHPIPVVARNNACALASTSNEFDGPRVYRPPTVPLTLRINLKNADDGLPTKKIPVRLLWGVRTVALRLIDAEHRDALPRYSAVALADEDGHADFSIPPELLAENNLEHGRYDKAPQIMFAAIPYADDRIGLDPVPRDFNGRHSPMELSPGLSHYGLVMNSPHAGAVAVSAAAGLVMTGPHGGLVVTNPHTGPTVTSPHGDSLHDVLATIAERETKWRSGKDLRELQVPDLSTIRIYALQWPAADLFWRAYDLITLPADVEADASALIRLQRNELGQAFEALCAGDEQARAPNAHSVLRALWWFEAQTDGINAATRNAQGRAQEWENGTRCTYRDGKLVSGGATQPPIPLTLDKVCGAWHDIRARLNAAPGTSVLPVTQMQVDFSHRANACTD